MSEGAGARSFTEDMDQDEPGLREGARRARWPRSKTASLAVFSNQSPPASLKELAARSTRPLLLIAAPNSPTARELNRDYPARRASKRRCGRSPSRATSAGSRRGPRSTSGAWSGSSTRRWRDEGRPGEARVFVVATLVALVHAVDDAFVHRGPGLGLGQHALAGLVALAGRRGARWSCSPALRPGLRAALAVAFGGFALVNGTMHVVHIARPAPAGGDLTGAAPRGAGVVLVGLAVVIPWRHRGEGTWRSRAVAVPAGVLAVGLCSGPIAMGIGSTHKWREPVGVPPGAAYQDVAFEASDGLDLAGWYRPSRERRRGA